MTRFLLVEIDAALDRSRRVGIWCAVKQIPGVAMLCDLEAVSRETLETILFKPEPTVPVVLPERAEQAALL